MVFWFAEGLGREETCASHQLEDPRSFFTCALPLFALSLKVCTQSLQLSFSFSPPSQEVLKLSYISKTKVEQGFLIRPTEKRLPWSLCDSGNFCCFGQESCVPQHWESSVQCQFDVMFSNPAAWNENCRLCFSHNWILFVVTSSTYWKCVKDCTLTARFCWGAQVCPSSKVSVAQPSNKQGWRRQPHCWGPHCCLGSPSDQHISLSPFLSETWKPHCSSSSRKSWKFLRGQRTPMLGRQGNNTDRMGFF